MVVDSPLRAGHNAAVVAWQSDELGRDTRMKADRSCSRAFRVSVLLVALLALTAGVCLAALEQPRARAQLIPGLQERMVQLPPTLATRLRATKPKADLAALRRAYLVRDGVPLIRVAGQEMPMLAVDKLAYTPSKAQVAASQALVGPTAKYRDFI